MSVQNSQRSLERRELQYLKMLCKHRHLPTREESSEVAQTSAKRPNTNFSSSKPLKGKHGYLVAGMATYIFLLDGALLAVVGIRHAGPPADDTAALVGAVVALVTDAHQSAGPHVRVTDHTLAVTCEHRMFPSLQNDLLATPTSEEKLPRQRTCLCTQR